MASHLPAQEGQSSAPALAHLALFGTGAPEGTVALFGHGFEKGALLKSDAVMMRLADGRGTLRTQINPVTTWPDGSVKVALLAVACPAMPNGTTQACVLVKSPAQAAAPLDLAAALKGRTAISTITPTNGAAWSFDLLAAAVGAKNQDRWHVGPLAVSTRVETKVPAASVGGITSLRLLADVIVTQDGLLEIDHWLANDIVMKAGGGHATYAYQVVIDGQTVFSQPDARHLQYTA